MTRSPLTRRVALAIAALILPGAARAQPPVLIGSVAPHVRLLADPGAMAPLIATGRIGLYQHANGNAQLPPAQRTVLWATWQATGVTSTGQGRSVGEIGGTAAGNADPIYLSYFGGAYPDEVNANVAGGSGTYIATNADARPGQSYAGFFTTDDLEIAKAGLLAAMAHGAHNAAAFQSPNGGQEDLDDRFASGAYWANVRALALAGGGIAIDAPPSYFFARGAPYMAMIEQMIRWGLAHRLRVSYVVSPYALQPDPGGNVGGCGRDPQFATAAARLVALLRRDAALPTQWVVEAYGQSTPGRHCGSENDVEPAAVPDSLNAVALMLAHDGLPEATQNK